MSAKIKAEESKVALNSQLENTLHSQYKYGRTVPTARKVQHNHVCQQP